MKKFALVFMFAGLLMSCDSDDDVIDDGGSEGETVEYAINPYGDSEVGGMITFTENEDGSITADIELENLENTEEGETYPAVMLAGNETEDDVVLTFEDVDGGEGTSSTTFSTWGDDEDVSWDEFMEFDGFVAIYSEEDTVVAQGGIGGYELTGESETYDLGEVEETGVSGVAIFEERMNGETLVTLKLEGTSEEGEHPAHIHAGSVGDEGDIVISLDSVEAESGWSQTNISHYDDTEEEEEGEAISYEELLEIDGYINVHESAESLEVIIAQGNVGENVEDAE